MTPIARQTSSNTAMIPQPSLTFNKISNIYSNTLVDRPAEQQQTKQVIQAIVLQEDPNCTAPAPVNLLQKTVFGELDEFLTVPTSFSPTGCTPKLLDEDLFNFLRPEIEENLDAPIFAEKPAEHPSKTLDEDCNKDLSPEIDEDLSPHKHSIETPDQNIYPPPSSDQGSALNQVDALKRCRARYFAIYNEKNKERINANRSEYRRKNKESLKTSRKEHS